LTPKRGQIAHIDRDSRNPSPENLVFLCLDHHDEYDSRTSQSKGITSGEVVHYRDELYEALTRTGESFLVEQPDPEPETPAASSAEDVLQRRLEMYRSVRDFLRGVLTTADPSLDDIERFATETQEAALFYDDATAKRIETIRHKAIRLRHVVRRLNDVTLPPGEERGALAEEDAELLFWFEQQLTEMTQQLGLRIRFG
jgi:hypothetical protein